MAEWPDDTSLKFVKKYVWDERSYKNRQMRETAYLQEVIAKKIFKKM